MVCLVGGDVTKENRSRLDKVIRKVGGVIGKTQDALEEIYHRWITAKLTRILQDKTRPLRSRLDYALIEHSGRMRAPKSMTVRYSLPFVPVTVGIFNSSKKRMLLDWRHDVYGTQVYERPLAIHVGNFSLLWFQMVLLCNFVTYPFPVFFC